MCSSFAISLSYVGGMRIKCYKIIANLMPIVRLLRWRLYVKYFRPWLPFYLPSSQWVYYPKNKKKVHNHLVIQSLICLKNETENNLCLPVLTSSNNISVIEYPFLYNSVVFPQFTTCRFLLSTDMQVKFTNTHTHIQITIFNLLTNEQT